MAKLMPQLAVLRQVKVTGQLQYRDANTEQIKTAIAVNQRVKLTFPTAIIKANQTKLLDFEWVLGFVWRTCKSFSF